MSKRQVEGVAIGIRATVERMLDPEAGLRDVALATAILADKALLLSGMATSRTETAEAGPALSDEEARQLRHWLDPDAVGVKLLARMLRGMLER